MKAMVQYRYGIPAEVLELREIAKPVVKDDEVLVRVRAASLHPDVWHVVSGRPYALRLMGAGLRRPKHSVPGTDVAGHVEAVGQHVTQFQQGDAVFGESTKGHQWTNGGAYAEYVAVPRESLALKPAGITFEQAATVPTSGFIALSGLRHEGQVQPGQRVLINGAGGGVGALAVQLAKAYGAAVTGVDSTGKLDLIRSLGADHVIDYTQEDFTQRGERYDLILDVPGNHSFSQCRRALTPEGTYVLIGHDHFGAAGGRWLGSLPRVFKLTVMSAFVSQLPALSFSVPSKQDAMAVLSEFLDAGKITPVVARTFPLKELPTAIRYLEEGHAQGKIVITV
ncbi:MAG: NAD(P)-dependent alcohol dehydrogenase [Dehalococcoidia bacterium]|nr:NAD(P)-dependent alcohol dehydrogenase [Dehalococcoidia bacterium]